MRFLLSPRAAVGVVVVAVFVLLLSVIGVALDSESRDDFQDRQSADRGSSADGRNRAGPADDRLLLSPDGELNWPEDARYLDRFANSDVAGFRVVDGRVEVVAIDDFDDGDYAMTLTPDGLDVTTPDGRSRQFWVTSSGWLIEAGGGMYPQASWIIEEAAVFGADHQPDPSRRPLVHLVGDGYIAIDLDDDGDLIAAGPTAYGPDGRFHCGDVLRLDDDGLLEWAAFDDVDDDDTLATVTTDGLDLSRPDGNRVEFEFGPDDRLAGREWTENGERLEVVRNPDGSFTLDDGTVVGPFERQATDDARTAEGDAGSDSAWGGFQPRDLPWRWVVITLVCLTVASLALALIMHLRAEPYRVDVPAFAVPRTEDEFERFIDGLRRDRDPTRAVRLAFQVAEQGLGGLPPRNREETPLEWQQRVEPLRPELAPALATLCGLFSMIRFGGRSAGEHDREVVIDAVQALRRTGPATPVGASVGSGDSARPDGPSSGDDPVTV